MRCKYRPVFQNRSSCTRFELEHSLYIAHSRPGILIFNILYSSGSNPARNEIDCFELDHVNAGRSIVGKCDCGVILRLSSRMICPFIERCYCLLTRPKIVAYGLPPMGMSSWPVFGNGLLGELPGASGILSRYTSGGTCGADIFHHFDISLKLFLYIFITHYNISIVST